MSQENKLGKAQQRTEQIRLNHIEAEECAHSGDELCAAGSYLEATHLYADAVRLWTTNVGFRVKLATAYIQTKQYEQAELMAARALSINPKLIEARYQRGLARLEQKLLRAAQIDFEAVLTHEPAHVQSHNALERVYQELSSGNAELGDNIPSDRNFRFPEFREVELEVEDVSDSEECHHVGNRRPCRLYNRARTGCEKGVRCKFMHAPDERSVRDTLGRNVCLYHLLGSCEFGDAKCAYSHEKTWLPEKGWWMDGAQIERVKRLVAGLRVGVPEDGRGFLGKVIPKPAKQGNVGRNRKRQHRHARQKRGQGKPKPTEDESEEGMDDFDLSDSEFEERMSNFGFRNSELQELISQGVKPWDDDAWDVLDVLYSM